MQYTLPRGYLSPSALSTFYRCPRQYEFRYIHGLIVPPNAAMVMGGAAHRTIEQYFRDAMRSGGGRLTGKQAAELSVEVLADYLKEEGADAAGPLDLDSMRYGLRTLTETYVDHVAADIEPLAVEEDVRFTMASGVPVFGRLDLRHRLRPDGAEEGICDYKITAKKWSPAQVSNSLQFLLYSYATGIRDVQVHNLVKSAKAAKLLGGEEDADGVKDVASNLRVLHHVFDGSDADHLERLVSGAAELITKGLFPPCDPGSWACGSDWCGYWSSCRGKTRALAA
jgi:RecB family exonuclease